MSRSKFSNYRRGVKYILITRYEWSPELADMWIARKNQLLWEAWVYKISRRESAKSLVTEVSNSNV